MPTNVSPEYKKAEAEYKKARDPEARLISLREMLRTIPKHKGTEHLQADIKTRIKQFTDELSGGKKGGPKSSGPTHAIRPDGAAQIALIGPPNSGKSTLHAKLTGSTTTVGPYPFTTHEPIPGMYDYQHIPFQLVDLPPVSAEYFENWYANALQPADAAMLVLDLSDPECLDHVGIIRERLQEKKISLVEGWPHLKGFLSVEEEEDDEANPFHIELPTLLVANKSDLDPDPEEVAVLEELLGIRYPAAAVSALTGSGLDEIGRILKEGLGIVRVYTKAPGKSAEEEKPYTLRIGDTVMNVAEMIHKDFARELKFGRIWGSGQFDGQQVGPDHPVQDGDILELHI